MEVGVLDVVIDFQPLEEALLHVGGAEGQAVADVVEEQAGALREEAAHEEGLERHVADVRVVLHGEEVEDVAVEDEQRVGAAVPAAGQFERPALQGEAGWGGGGGSGGVGAGGGFSFHGGAVGEVRNPKAEGRKKARSPKSEDCRMSASCSQEPKRSSCAHFSAGLTHFGLRISAFFRASGFGLRISSSLLLARRIALLKGHVLR